MFNPHTTTPATKQVENLNYRQGGFHPVHLRDKFKKDRYQVIHKLGHGGFATVWLARDDNRKRYVALKILAASVSSGCPEVETLRRLKIADEAQGKGHVMLLLDHFWIDGPNGRHLCVVSEVAGPSIKEFNDSPGKSSGSRRLRGAVARKVALQVTHGLAFIHSTGTVHGDFTPANILLRIANIDLWSEEEIYERLGKPQLQELPKSIDGVPNRSAPEYTMEAVTMKEVDPQWLSDQIMIIDFGISFLRDDSSSSIGTPKSYCAPEFCFNGPRSIWSDMWALGCTIFEIRTGSRLFNYKNRPTNPSILQSMVKILGPLPEQWWSEWEEGREWYALETKAGGSLASNLQGTLYSKILSVGVHDGENLTSSSLRASRQGHQEKHTTSRLLALVEELTTSEAEEVLARTSNTDPEKIEFIHSDVASGSGSGSSGAKNSTANSGSSNAKSGEKSISSEGISTGPSAANPSNKEEPAERPLSSNSIGDQNFNRSLLPSVEELSESEDVDLLEQTGMRISILEVASLENLLRRVLLFLPEQRLCPSELAKHHWFLDDFED